MPWSPPRAAPRNCEGRAVSSFIAYVNALFVVFTIVILLRILMSFITIVPSRRSTQAVYDFIIDSTEWYLRIFRRIIPPLGMFDLSPIIAFLVLGILNILVNNVLSGF